MTRVVNLKKEKYDIYIGRPSKWGNPYELGRDGNRKTVLEKYRLYLLRSPGLLKDLTELKDKVLGCFCRPFSCHGDVLISLLEERFNDKK
jgi:hypothetical protein